MEVDFNHRRRGSAFGNAAAAAATAAAAARDMAEMGYSYSSSSSTTAASSATQPIDNRKKKKNVDTEVSSAMIRNFDIDDDGNNKNDDDDDEFYDNDDSAYDAVFGRSTSANSLSISGSHSRNNNKELEEALDKERRTKCVLFAILMIVSITCLSTIITQKRLLRLNNGNDEYKDKNNRGNNNLSGDDGIDDDRATVLDDFLNRDDGGSSSSGYGNGNDNGNDNGNTDEYSNNAVNTDTDEDSEFSKYDNKNYYGEMENNNNEQQHGLFGPDDEEESEYAAETTFNSNEENEDNTATGTIESTSTSTSTSSNDQNENNQGMEEEEEEEEEKDSISSSQNENNDVDAMVILESRFGNVREQFQMSGKDTPFLFFVPRTGSALVENLLLQCNQLVAASGRNAIGDNHGYEPYLEIITTPSNEKFVNVDLRTNDGINRANKLNLVGSKLADVIFSSRLQLTSEIFHPPYRGRCFTLLRDPIERATSVFYALKNSPWETSFKEEFSDMTIEEYAFSDYLESNWMVRMISNKMSGQITDDDLEEAKYFISEKCLVGLTARFDESYERIKKYFGWDIETDTACEKELMGSPDDNQESLNNRFLAEKISKVVYDQFYKQNELDVQLYEHALEIFEKQKSLVQ